MSDALARLLARIRTRLGRPAEARGAEEVAARPAGRATGPIPARARVEGEARVALFTKMAKAVGSEVERLAHPGEVPGAVLRYLRFHNLPKRLVAAADPLLEASGLARAPLLEVRTGAVTADDPVGITVAEAGVAETGTLVLASTPERPTMLAFLPETAIVLLPLDRLDGSYEESWQRIRERFGTPPRSVNFVTGPSRTADIGLRLIMGAHGPKRLLILLVDRTESA